VAHSGGRHFVLRSALFVLSLPFILVSFGMTQSHSTGAHGSGVSYGSHSFSGMTSSSQSSHHFGQSATNSGFASSTPVVHPPTGTPPLGPSRGVSSVAPAQPYVCGSRYTPCWYAVPYFFDWTGTDPQTANSQAANDDNAADFQSGPAPFDPNGTQDASSADPAGDAAAADPLAPQDAPSYVASDLSDSASDAPAQPTILVFKDGHEIEVANYAIVGQTLYDLTTGHHRKIALSDLDLPATEQKNDDRGVAFQLPPSIQGS
jgi:hypothetical protein